MTNENASARELAKWLHFRLAAAQNLPYEDGDVCDDCIAEAMPMYESIAKAAAAEATERAAGLARKMGDAASIVLQKGHDDDAAVQFDTANEIEEAIRAQSPDPNWLARVRAEARLKENEEGWYNQNLDVRVKHLLNLRDELQRLAAAEKPAEGK
jgi:hypothetical protein